MIYTENEPKKIKTEGTTRYVWEGKLHNWNGPAVVYEDGRKEYYIHGMPLSEKEFGKRLKAQEGLPWFKSAGMKGKVRF